VGDVALDRVLADDQPLGDLGVRQAAGDEREDLGLARRELVDRGRRFALQLPATRSSSRRVMTWRS
jgi:hypothetical protein